MARRCLQCGHAWGWKLTDGRFKCRRCNSKYSWKSVWNGSRLQDRTKQQLLADFLAGGASSLLGNSIPVSTPTRQRFFRLIRAVLAYHEYSKEPCWPGTDGDQPREDYGSSVPGHSKRGGNTIIIIISQQENGIQFLPATKSPALNGIDRLALPRRQGSLFFQANGDAFTFLRVRGSHVIIPKEKTTCNSFLEIKEIEDFWNYAMHSLSTHRGIQAKFLPLYLGEFSFRFNHSHEDLYQIIHHLLQKTSMFEIEPLLAETV